LPDLVRQLPEELTIPLLWDLVSPGPAVPIEAGQAWDRLPGELEEGFQSEFDVSAPADEAGYVEWDAAAECAVAWDEESYGGPAEGPDLGPGVGSGSDAVDGSLEVDREGLRVAESPWAAPAALAVWLERLKCYPATAAWAVEVQNRVNRLTSLASLDDPLAGPEIDELNGLLAQVLEVLELCTEEEAAAAVRRTASGLARRVVVWRQTHVAALEAAALDVFRPGSNPELQLEWLNGGGLGGGPDPSQAVIDGWMGQPSVDVRGALASFLSELEAYESAPGANRASLLLAAGREAVQAGAEAGVPLTSRLQDSYGQCNLRVAVSAELLNRLIPTQPAIDSVVNDTVMNLPVYGKSRTTTQLSVRLNPRQGVLDFALVARGIVESHTTAESGPASIHTASDSSYEVVKPMEISPLWIHAAPATARASARSRLTGVDSSLDGVPVLGPMFRNLVRNKHAQKEGESRFEVRRRVEKLAVRQMDREVEQRLALLEKEFDRQVMVPLKGLSLEPSAVHLETTHRRLIARMKLAGEGQLAAHTPRPRAWSDSLVSVQVHESAVNNFLARLELEGKTFTLPELDAWIGQKLNRTLETSPESLMEDVEITFADQDALSVRAVDGRLELSIGVACLRYMDQEFENVRLIVAFRPDPVSLSADLVRDGTVQIQAEELSSREYLTLRGITSKVFSKNRRWNMVPGPWAADPRLADLAVTQFDMVDGWVAVAVGPAEREKAN
jgi:hypothetical protein